LARPEASGYAGFVAHLFVSVLAAAFVLAGASMALAGDVPPDDGAGKPGEARARVLARAPRVTKKRARLDTQAGRDRTGSAGRLLSSKPESDAAARARAPRSASVGSPNEGRLENGVHLDTSKPWFRVVPSYAVGDVRWGLPALVNLLDRAARSVHKRWPGSALDVGDLSRKGGGDVSRHHSHESGRDADVGFYVTDAKGKPVHARTFIRFGADMKSPTVRGARFDEAKTWHFVQMVLTDPGAHVSHIFIAEPLRQRLLAYARSRGVSRALLDRAAIAMMQPTNSLPHDDHMHIRISCSRSDKGCVELAKNAPSRARVARASRARQRRPVLLTPARAARFAAAESPPASPLTASAATSDPYDDARVAP
jgi:penicillin-insensitive murein DD-endopeptidase